MAIRAGLIIQTEFLRLVLRQLLRRQVGVEIVGDGTTLADAARLAHATLFIVEQALCQKASDVRALLDQHPGAQVIILGDGEALPALAGLPPERLTHLATGSGTSAIDPSALAACLDSVLRGQRAARPISERPERVPLETEAAPAKPRPGVRRRPAVIGIAASTGGPEVLQELLLALAPPPCPIVVALHIPAAHTDGLISHLAQATRHRVTLGETGTVLTPGVYILQGGVDHAVIAEPDRFLLRRVRDGASVFHPNGDVLLTSLARLGRAVVGVVLTGMGKDGSNGARALADAGYPVLAQSPATCAVPGMPAAAIDAGAVTETAPPAGLARRLNDWLQLPLAGD